ncbi:MAG: hypothetical protein KIT14_10085 [bacterium]|nr:hypothetical protein [bacterium]
MPPWTCALLGLVVAGCAARGPVAEPRPFRFGVDTLAFPNETAWEYRVDAHGNTEMLGRDPEPDFVLRCGAMVRTGRLFHRQARFDPAAPPADETTYRRLVAEVLARDPRAAPGPPIVIPAFADLHAFSAAHEALFKAAMPSAYQSYLQRGNWRMIFPFTATQQRAQAEEMLAAVRAGATPILHIVEFPTLYLNHLILVFDAEDDPETIRFRAWDPNDAAEPIVVTWDRGAAQFRYPRVPYYAGGPVRAYTVYDGLLY